MAAMVRRSDIMLLQLLAGVHFSTASRATVMHPPLDRAAISTATRQPEPAAVAQNSRRHAADSPRTKFGQAVMQSPEIRLGAGGE
jgi:hypothetical protein